MKVTKSSGNVFADIGFDEAEAEVLAVKANLVSLLSRAIRLRNLTQAEAAAICGTEQATLSKALNGKLQSLTLDRLAKWLIALNWTVKFTAAPPTKARARQARAENRAAAH